MLSFRAKVFHMLLSGGEFRLQEGDPASVITGEKNL